jgi:hypothetical protein
LLMNSSKPAPVGFMGQEPRHAALAKLPQLCLK